MKRGLLLLIATAAATACGGPRNINITVIDGMTDEPIANVHVEAQSCTRTAKSYPGLECKTQTGTSNDKGEVALTTEYRDIHRFYITKEGYVPLRYTHPEDWQHRGWRREVKLYSTADVPDLKNIETSFLLSPPYDHSGTKSWKQMYGTLKGLADEIHNIDDYDMHVYELTHDTTLYFLLSTAEYCKNGEGALLGIANGSINYYGRDVYQFDAMMFDETIDQEIVPANVGVYSFRTENGTLGKLKIDNRQTVGGCRSDPAYVMQNFNVLYAVDM